MSGGDERERRQDRLPLWIESFQEKLHADGCIANRNDFDIAVEPSEPRLELLDERTVVRQPASVEHLVEPRVERLAVRNRRHANVTGRAETRLSAADYKGTAVSVVSRGVVHVVCLESGAGRGEPDPGATTAAAGNIGHPGGVVEIPGDRLPDICVERRRPLLHEAQQRGGGNLL